MSEELCVMTVKSDAKFKGKLTCGLKIDMRNLVNFHASRRMSEKLHFDWILLSKAYRNLAKNYTRIIFHDTEKRSKHGGKTDFFLNNDMRNLVNFNPRSGKSENFHFDKLPFVESM